MAQAALYQVHASGHSIESLRGVAYFDLGKDEIFTALPEFGAARTAVASLPLVQERYGGAQAHRVTLQFVYEWLNRLSAPSFDETAFGGLWEDFCAEVEDPEWVYIAVANVRWVQAEETLFDFGDGVSIRARTSTALAELGFTEFDLHGLFEDVSGPGASSYVMVVETRAPKTPENLILGNLGTEWTKALRVLGALRLLASGDISIGRMWLGRRARFNVGFGGSQMSGFSIPAMGGMYRLTRVVASKVPFLYDNLRHLEAHGYRGAPGNLDLALRSFMSTYDRWPPGGDSRVLDSITAVEAVLGSGIEIAFKLSFRMAGILGANDAERVAIFEDMKAYYDLRSRLVHGGALKQKHHDLLGDTERLRHLVRQLLNGLIHLAINPQEAYGKRFFEERLDSALQQESTRTALRAALGLG